MFLKPPDNLTPFAKHSDMKPGPENHPEKVKGQQVCDLFHPSESDIFYRKSAFKDNILGCLDRVLSAF